MIDALSPLGVRHLDMPLTRDRVWRAIRDAEARSRSGPQVNLQYTGEEKIPAAFDTVWAFVSDPDKVGHCLPEVVEVTVQDATHFDAVVKVGVGPVRGKFKMKVELLPDAAPAASP